MAEGAQQPRPATESKGTDLGDEYLFYDRERDQVHVLNGTAREIFLLCDGRRTETEVATAFADRYEAHRDEARKDAEETLRRLYDLGLLTH